MSWGSAGEIDPGEPSDSRPHFQVSQPPLPLEGRPGRHQPGPSAGCQGARLQEGSSPGAPTSLYLPDHLRITKSPFQA